MAEAAAARRQEEDDVGGCGGNTGIGRSKEGGLEPTTSYLLLLEYSLCSVVRYSGPNLEMLENSKSLQKTDREYSMIEDLLNLGREKWTFVKHQ